LSQSELTLTFGLGSATEAALAVTWPGGKVETIGNVKANQLVTIREGAGQVRAEPLKR